MPPIEAAINNESGLCSKRSSGNWFVNQRYRNIVPNRPTTQKAMTTAVTHPIILIQSGRVKCDITRGSVVNFIITTMIGAAMTPLMTALQYSARMGSIGRKLMIVPIAVAVARVM
jgi:hypothetical protein